VLLLSARAVRDALAEAKGCIRVVVRIKPLLAFEATQRDSLLGATMRWLVQNYSAQDPAALLHGDAGFTTKLSQPGATRALDACARYLGWPGSFHELYTLLHASLKGEFGGPTDGRDELSCDAGPLALAMGLNSEATKEVLAVPALLPASAVLRALQGGAQHRPAYGDTPGPGGLPAHLFDPRMEALIQQLTTGRALDAALSFEFDRVLPTSSAQEDVFEGEANDGSSLTPLFALAHQLCSRHHAFAFLGSNLTLQRLRPC